MDSAVSLPLVPAVPLTLTVVENSDSVLVEFVTPREFLVILAPAPDNAFLQIAPMGFVLQRAKDKLALDLTVDKDCGATLPKEPANKESVTMGTVECNME